jgi:hypothetical protein
VCRDAVGSGALAQNRGSNRVGFYAASRLANGRDVIDVDM